MKYGNISVPKFLNEVKEELKKVSWPTKNETIRLTTIVLISCIISGTFLGIVDFLFTNIFSYYLKI
jgi:preprotein translocase subunit SecE